MGLVIDFGAPSLPPVREAVEMIFRDQHCAIRVTEPADAFVDDRPFEGSLAEALDGLAAGTYSSVVVSVSSGFAGMYCPRFAGGTLADWIVSVEGVGDHERLIEALLASDGLTFVATSQDDSPDYEQTHVDVESFPWDDWRLVEAAVRGADGAWVRRRGRY